jgi:predicted enzyme related to lactoylglutathione lyase
VPPLEKKAQLEFVLDCVEPSVLASFWREALGFRDYFTDEDISVLVPEAESGSPLILQRVPEPKAGKNRMHLDIIVEEIEPEIDRLVALGARRLDENAQEYGGTRWVRMSDPEHNEFCVSTGVGW